MPAVSKSQLDWVRGVRFGSRTSSATATCLTKRAYTSNATCRKGDSLWAGASPADGLMMNRVTSIVSRRPAPHERVALD